MQPDLERTIQVVTGGNAATAVVQAWESCAQILDEVLVAVEVLGERYEASSPNGWFDALLRIRKTLDSRGIFLKCFASSRNVYPSPMQEIDGLRGRAYRTTMGKHARQSDLVGIFDVDPDNQPATVEEQVAFHEAWLRSLLLSSNDN